VNEFVLHYRVSLRAYDREHDWIPAEEIALRRDYSYDDSKVLAKEAEEAMLYQSMRTDMVQQDHAPLEPGQAAAQIIWRSAAKNFRVISPPA